MPNPRSLVADFGPRYIREFFANAVFLRDGKVMKVRTADEENLHVHQFDVNAGNPRWEASTIRLSTLSDFTDFKWPKLGYRQYKQGKIGNIVVQVSTVRNAHRGLKSEWIQYESLPVFQAVDTGYIDGFDAVNEARRVKEIFKPTFTKFSEGIKQLLDGDVLGFAVNEDLAVGLSINTAADRGADVYFRGRVVGNVDETGKVTIVNKILQRESLKKKLFN